MPYRMANLSRGVLSLAMSVSLVILPVAGAVHAASVDDLNAKKKVLDDQIKKAEQEKTQQKTVAERAQQKIAQVNAQIDYLSASIDNTNTSLQDVQAQIEQKNQDIAQKQSELGQNQQKQGVLVREMYKRQQSLPDSLVVLSNEPISKREQDREQFESLRRMLLAMYAKVDAERKEVQQAKDDLAKKQQDLTDLKSQQQEQQVGLADVKLQQAQLKDNAEQAVVDLEAKQKQARIEEQKIEQQISAALSAAIAKANASGKISSSAAAGRRVSRGDVVGHEGSTGFSTGPHVHFEVRLNGSPVNPAPYVSSGTLTWPISSFVISQGFGYTNYAASGAYGGSIHTGIDLAGPYGIPVHAPADGVVILNQYYGGYGNAWAEQLDNGLVVLLGHMTGR